MNKKCSKTPNIADNCISNPIKPNNKPKTCRKNAGGPRSKNKSEQKWRICPFKGCTYKNKYKGYLRMHMLKHKNELELTKPFPCEICDYRAASRACLDRHVRRRHELEKKKLPCPWCPSAFYWTQALKNHVLLFHKDEKKLKCDRCKFTFRHQRCFQTHVKIEGDKNCQIIYCTVPDCRWCASKCSVRVTSNQQQKSRQLLPLTAQPGSQGKVNINCEVETNSKLIFQCELCNCEGEGKQWAVKHSAIHRRFAIGSERIS